MKKMAVSDIEWSELDHLRQLKEDHLREIERLRAALREVADSPSVGASAA
jgi:hypothetical protein